MGVLTRLPVSRKQQSRERSLVVHLKLVLFTPQPYPHTYERCVELRARLICVAVRALGSYLVNSKAHCFTQQQSIDNLFYLAMSSLKIDPPMIMPEFSVLISLTSQYHDAIIICVLPTNCSQWRRVMLLCKASLRFCKRIYFRPPIKTLFILPLLSSERGSTIRRLQDRGSTDSLLRP